MNHQRFINERMEKDALTLFKPDKTDLHRNTKKKSW